MKKYPVSVVCLLISASAGAADFGVADWHSDRQSITEAEQRTALTPGHITDYLVYEGALSSIGGVQIVYWLDRNGQLIKGGYLFPGTEQDAPAALLQYDETGTMITRKYGEPEQQNERWNPGSGAADRNNKAIALIQGNLILQRVWQTETAVIRQQLMNSEGRMKHQIIYTPPGDNI